MRYTLCLFAVLAFIWLANSGHYTPLLLVFGFLSVVFVILIVRRMGVVDRESQPLHLMSGLPGYYWWLFTKIVRSNIQVAACAWRGKGAISPCSARLPTSLRSDLGRVLYANSITLTPGTVAVDLEGDEVVVHALTREGLAELQTGEMERKVKALEK